MKRSWGIVLMGLALIVLSGCTPQPETAVAVDAVAVRVMPVENNTLEKQVSFSGSVASKKEVGIFSTLSGEVISKRVQVGTAVGKDQVLLDLDAENTDRSVEQAKRALELAQVNYNSAKTRYEDALLTLERNKTLFESGVLSQSQYEQFETAASSYPVDSAKLQLDQARLSYESVLNTSEGTAIKAPFSGIIASLSPEEGSMITPGQPIGTIVDLSSLKVTIDVTEKKINELTYETPVEIVVPALNDKVIPAQIASIAPIAAQNSKLFQIEVNFDNPHGDVKPGMFVVVNVRLLSASQHVIVPYDAVLYDEAGYYVYIVADEKPIKRLVQLGENNGAMIEVVDGISPGDLLIISGQSFVKEDSVLNIIRGE